MTCYICGGIAAPCQQGHAHDGPVHVVSDAKTGKTEFHCADHCPVHGAQQMMEWAAPARTITGEQEGLF